MNTQSPANTTEPSPGKAAATSPEATGGKAAESMTGVQTETEQLDPDVIAAQFLGEVAEGARTDATNKRPEDKAKVKSEKGKGESDPDLDTDTDADEHQDEDDEEDAGDGSDADSDGEDEEEGEDSSGEAATTGRGKLSHLLDAFAKKPDDAGLRKRLEKILGEPPKLKQELAKLREEMGKVETLPPVVAPASVSSPLAHVGSMAQLEQEVEMAETWIEWCEANPDGGQYDAKNDKAVFDADQVKAQLRFSKAVLRAESARRDWLTKLDAHREKLKTAHPELFKKDSPELKALLQPVLDGRVTVTHPDYMQDLLDLQRGRKEREDEAKGIKKVVLDTKKAKAAAAAAKPGGGAEATSTTRPGAGGAGGPTKKPAMQPASAAVDLAALRKRSVEGDQKANDDIALAFLGTAKG